MNFRLLKLLGFQSTCWTLDTVALFFQPRLIVTIQGELCSGADQLHINPLKLAERLPQNFELYIYVQISKSNQSMKSCHSTELKFSRVLIILLYICLDTSSSYSLY